MNIYLGVPNRNHGVLSKNAIFEMKVDPKTREIRFVIDGKDCGVANILPEGVQEYFGYVALSSLYDERFSFEFLDSHA